MVTRNNIVLAGITTLSLTVIGALLSATFSPLSENIRDYISKVPNAKINYAKVFSDEFKAVAQDVSPGTTNVTSSSITFWFSPGTNDIKDTKQDYLVNTGVIQIPFPQLAGKHHFLNFADYSLFPSDSLYQFECSIDGQPFEQCISPKHYGDLDTEAMHIFKVRTKGILGNTQDIATAFNFTSVTASYVKGIVMNSNQTVINGVVRLDDNSNTKNTSSRGAFSFRDVTHGIHNLTVTPPIFEC